MSELDRLSVGDRKAAISAVTAIARWADTMLNSTVSEVIEAIYRLINFRDSNNLPTIYTSNNDLDHCHDDERIRSRIDGHSYPLFIPEVSIRKRNADRKREQFTRDVIGFS